jgi:hypothetical protein
MVRIRAEQATFTIDLLSYFSIFVKRKVFVHTGIGVPVRGRASRVDLGQGSAR